MTFPAFFDVMRDHAITARPTALRVYAELLGDGRIMYEARTVKVSSVALCLGVKRHHVGAAIDLLVGRGYLLEHGRTEKNIRKLSLPLTRQSTAA